ncbi:hypothetical protein TSTA_055100 [Talaromyces stipitatus ATCC 10500]|uniref:Uncharacterized protein n=1 Tax=Talaromyces stipitatus (strain ATCC 10500 / CBS 375.48 / QM 6759 / NRRL 1006) TaxID=441959 RepID=B8MRA9_TALSN|nr:uncharacterized protein TSTA_055100 [Talaromyces stipitatus ATCC 10500]EED13004.1 hypothetical protein TSTA_055100 [Talaromyces stipitatus ATCC 10500]
MVKRKENSESMKSNGTSQKCGVEISQIKVDDAFAILSACACTWASDRWSTPGKCASIRAVVGFLKKKQSQLSSPKQKHWVASHQMAVFNIVARMILEHRCSELFDVVSNDQPSFARFLEYLDRWSAQTQVEDFIVKQRKNVLGETDRGAVNAKANYAKALHRQGKFADTIARQREVLERENLT